MAFWDDENGPVINLAWVAAYRVHYSDYGEPYAVDFRLTGDSGCFHRLGPTDAFLARLEAGESAQEPMMLDFQNGRLFDMSRTVEVSLYRGIYDLPEPNVARVRFMGEQEPVLLLGHDKDIVAAWLKSARETGVILRADGEG